MDLKSKEPGLAARIDAAIEIFKDRTIGCAQWLYGKQCEVYLRVCKLPDPSKPAIDNLREWRQAYVLANIASRAPGHGKAVFDYLLKRAEQDRCIFKVEHALNPKMQKYCEDAGMWRRNTDLQNYYLVFGEQSL